MPKPSDYFLSDVDNAAIFEEQIRPAEFGRFGDGATPVPANKKATGAAERPVCIILAGQTGAGKSHAAPAIAAALRAAYGGDAVGSGQGQQPYCHLVADTHKPYHPAYAGLVADAAAGKAPPGLASAATGFDARRWLARACTVAAGGPGPPRPTLVESASRYPQDVVEIASIFRRAGFHVCIVLLAVHAAQSRLGLLARYLDAAPSSETKSEKEDTHAKKALPVRLTPQLIHDESYAGLAELTGLLDSERESGHSLVDQVIILRRGNQVAYAHCYGAEGDSSTNSTSSTWTTSPPDVGRALAAERARRGVDTESTIFFTDVARLRATHPERAAELDALTAAYAADMAGDDEDTSGLGYLTCLDPAALVAHLRRPW